MVKLVQGTEAEASSYQPKRRGRKAKFTPGEKRERKRACDKKRYHKTQATLRQIKFIKKTNANLAFENRRLNSRIATLARAVRATNANLKLVKEHLMDMDNRIENFLQGQLKKNDWEIPSDNVFLGGENNWITDSEYPPGFFDLVGGMSKQEILAEFKKTGEHYEELKRENQELKREKEKLNSRVTDIETMIRAMTPKK